MFGKAEILVILVFLQLFHGSEANSKGQLISKWFLGSSISSKKRTKTSLIVVNLNSFVRFLEEINDPKNHFEIN